MNLTAVAAAHTVGTFVNLAALDVFAANLTGTQWVTSNTETTSRMLNQTTNETTTDSIHDGTVDAFSFWPNESRSTSTYELADSDSSNSNFADFSYENYSPCDPDNPNFNCSRQDFVTFLLGPQRLPLYRMLMPTIILCGIFITSVLGNVLVCVVIVRHSNMHTATNYYLFSLAVSDLLYLLFDFEVKIYENRLLGLPEEIIHYWHQYPYLFGLPFCKIRAYISEASTYVSVLTIVAFSMERFLAICHPLHLYAMSGFKRAVRIIAALWIVSFISAIPFGLLTNITYIKYPIDDAPIWESAYCVLQPDGFPLFELSLSIFFVIPMILIIVLYGRMGAQIRSTTAQQLGVQQGSMHRESRHSQSRKAVIRMLAAVVITFFICWLPFHMQRMWFMYAKEYENFMEINEWIFSIAGFTYYVTCTINPILYNVMSHRYRVAFKDILCGKRRSVYYNNGFARDQSSFRETTVASCLGSGGGGVYDRVHSVRLRSIVHNNHFSDRESLKVHNPLWKKKKEFTVPLQKNIIEDTGPPTPPSSSSPLLPKETSLALELPPPPPIATTIVVVDNGLNGRPKVYTENEAHESLIGNSDETCI